MSSLPAQGSKKGQEYSEFNFQGVSERERDFQNHTNEPTMLLKTKEGDFAIPRCC
jgi:hypothetical protein